MRGVWEGCEMKTSRKKGEIIFGGGFFFFGNKKIGFPKPPVVSTLLSTPLSDLLCLQR